MRKTPSIGLLIKTRKTDTDARRMPLKTGAEIEFMLTKAKNT